LCRPAAQAAAFAEHFEAVLGDGATVDASVLASAVPAATGDAWQLPTLADTLDAVRRLKHWRAADPAGVWAELLQAACRSDEFVQLLHSIVLQSMQQGMPAVVKASVLLPFFKKGNAADANNYRGIQLVSQLRKIIALILSKQLCSQLEPSLLEYQCGFRPQRGCADQLFTLRQLARLSVEWQQQLYTAFVDLRKAFDSISRPALWAILRARGVPERLVDILTDLHTGTTCTVRVANSHSRQFSMQFGVQQGCPLAPVLFNVFFDHVVREALEACPDAGVALRRRQDMGPELQEPDAGCRAPLVDLAVPLLMLADDLVILAATAADLQRFLTAFEAACQRWGLVISTEKTELMLIGGAAATACEGCGGQQGASSMLLCDGCDRGWHLQCLNPPLAAVPAGSWNCPGCTGAGEAQGDAWRPPVLVSGQPLAWVDKFKYLGSVFECSGSLGSELSRRVQLAADMFRRLQRPLFQQKCISLKTRMVVYKCMVTSILLYGSEAWDVSRAQLQYLEVFHRCRLRLILGKRLSDRISNRDLYSRCHADTIEVMLASRQLRWLGHLGRMEDTRLAKQMLYSTMYMPGRCRAVGGTRAHSLSRTYRVLEGTYMRAPALRARGLEVPRRSNWFTLCQDRALYKAACKLANV
jgi:hypothetical protein